MDVDDEIREFSLDMRETMKEGDGVGLAGPQVNFFKRIIVAKINDRDLVLINPEITWKSREKDEMEEGCLSLPEVLLKIKRSSRIKVEALDLCGSVIDLELEGLPARIIQHEVDHLNGKLILDRVSFWEKIKRVFKR